MLSFEEDVSNSGWASKEKKPRETREENARQQVSKREPQK
jgi:hypothetical protein